MVDWYKDNELANWELSQRIKDVAILEQKVEELTKLLEYFVSLERIAVVNHRVYGEVIEKTKTVLGRQK